MVLFSKYSWACKVVEQDLAALFEKSDKVFFGKVVDETKSKDGYKIKLDVIETFKAKLSNTVIVKTSQTSCRLSGQAGMKLVVFANNENYSDQSYGNFYIFEVADKNGDVTEVYNQSKLIELRKLAYNKPLQ